jgi:hypothetical protein
MNAPLPTERQVQRAILEMCGACFPDVYIHHSPNGAVLAGNAAQRGRQMGAMKGDGFKVGFPDLICIWRGGAAFIEVKRPKGSTTSAEQKAVHERLERLGYPVLIAKSANDAHAFLKACGAPCRGELQ